MFLGQTITKFDGLAWNSAPIPRGGDAATFVIECVHTHHVPTVQVVVKHKNEEDTTWSTLVTFSTFTTPGVNVASASGIKEQVMWEVTITSPDAEDAAVLIPYDPVWRPY
jgi:hypothetical protein